MLTSSQKWYQNIKKDPIRYKRHLAKKRKGFLERKYKNPESLERMKVNYRKWRDNTRNATFGAYGSKCTCCGEDKREFLCIDHVNGKGNQERIKVRKNGGIHFYAYLRRLKFPPGYRVLCHNCNMSFGTYGYCPHKTNSPSFF